MFTLDPAGQFAATKMEDRRILLAELSSGQILTNLCGKRRGCHHLGEGVYRTAA